MTLPPHLLDPAPFAERGILPEAVYCYRDAQGNPVGAVARFAPNTVEADRKSFRAWHYERGRYVRGLEGRKLPPYRLPELLAEIAAGKTVYAVEGEACCNALWDIGVPATTNSGGAGKWTAEHSALLKGANVVVLPDHDEPGLQHGEAVCASLQGVASRVRLLRLPGLAQKEDVIDWLRNGGTVEQLVKLADAATDWVPPSAESWPEPTYVFQDLTSQPFVAALMLPTVMADYTVSIAESVKICPSVPGGLSAVLLSIAAGNLYEVQVSLAYAEPNLSRYLLAVLGSGERKSRTFRVVFAPIDAWMAEQNKKYREALVKYRAEHAIHAKRARDAEKAAAGADTDAKLDQAKAKAVNEHRKMPVAPRKPQVLFGDTTPQQLVRMMHEAGGGFGICSGEGRIALDVVLGRYRADQQADDGVYLAAHGGDRIDRGRVGVDGEAEEIVIERPSLGVALGIQEDKLRELAGRSELFDSGFIPRCNAVRPENLSGTRFESGNERPPNETLAKQVKDAIWAILDYRWKLLPPRGEQFLDVLTLTLSPEAMKARREFFNELEREQGPGKRYARAQAFASKCAGEAARLAGLFHLFEYALAGNIHSAHHEQISLRVWQLAEAHQRWALHQTLRTLAVASETIVTSKARRLLAWAAREPAKRRIVSARDLVGSRIFDTAEEVQDVMQFLVDRFWARKVASQAGQRAPRYEFNPRVFMGAKQ